MMRSVLVGLFLIISPLTYAETLVIGVAYKENSPEFSAMSLYLQEIASRVEGLEISVIYRPLQRLKVELESKLIDGDSGRIEEVYLKSPNVFKVPEPIYVMDFVYYTNIDDHSADDLISGEYTVIAVRGNIAVQTFLENSNRSYSLVNTNEIAFKILNSNRKVYYIAIGLTKDIMESRGYIHSNVSVSNEPLFSIPLYLFLHNRFKKWLEPINKEIMDITKSGRFMEITGIE